MRKVVILPRGSPVRARKFAPGRFASFHPSRHTAAMFRKTLFVNPPSWQGFDGGAGSRYQAKREVRSFWFPTWLAQPAALIEGSRLVDAPPHDLTVEDVVNIA